MEWLREQESNEKQEDYDGSIAPDWGDLVTFLQKKIFETGKPPQAFSTGTLVLIPKAGEPGKFRGIALLDVLHKLIGSIIGERISSTVKFHDGIHGIRKNRGCSRAIIEAKLEMQLARQEGVQYHQVFLDLSKAYDTVDKGRMIMILKGYGVGPNLQEMHRSYLGSENLPNILETNVHSRRRHVKWRKRP